MTMIRSCLTENSKFSHGIFRRNSWTPATSAYCNNNKHYKLYARAGVFAVVIWNTFVEDKNFPRHFSHRHHNCCWQQQQQNHHQQGLRPFRLKCSCASRTREHIHVCVCVISRSVFAPWKLRRNLWALVLLYLGREKTEPPNYCSAKRERDKRKRKCCGTRACVRARERLLCKGKTSCSHSVRLYESNTNTNASRIHTFTWRI